MSMHRASSPTDRRSTSAPRAHVTRAGLLRVALSGLLGVLAALLVACSGSSKGLIPAADAGPLQSDFEAVAQKAANGDCAATNAALLKTEDDFGKLPASVDAGLRGRLREGITKLRPHALEACEQPQPQATVTTSKPKTSTSTTPTSSTTTPTETQSTPTETQSTPTQTSPPGPGGGTPAPGEGTPGGGGEERGSEAGGASGGAKVQGPQEGTK